MHCGIILLAAGGSLRLGQPKQLLLYKGQSLLAHSIDAAAGAGTDNIIMVAGSHPELIQKETANKKITLVVNTEWQKGMASSIVTGLKAILRQQPLTDAVIMMTCDQPFTSEALLTALINKHRKTGKWIVTSDYGDTTGPPTLFHKALFEELFLLQGDKGARTIVQKYPGQTTTVSFPQGKIDIDTFEDYEELLKHTHNENDN